MKEGGGQWIVPLGIMAIGVVAVKGLFTFNRSRSQDRKDFLDLWAKADKADDLWVQVAVRHVFGDVLPPALIRRFLVHPQGARALGDMAYAWPLLDMDESTGELRWRRERHYSERARRWEWRAWMATYFVTASAMFGFAWFAVVYGKTLMGLSLWVLAVETGFFAARALMKSERLGDAHTAVPRWTKGLRWKYGGPDVGPIRLTGRGGKKAQRGRSD